MPRKLIYPTKIVDLDMTASGASVGQGSEDVAKMQALLKEAGVTDYEPRVISQLLDVAYATTAELLTGARTISQHCGKTTIEEEDIQMALDFTDHLKDYYPERAKIVQMAQEKNSQPLPQIRHNFGLKLPNDRFCLLQPNVEWRGPNPQAQATQVLQPQSFNTDSPQTQPVRHEHVVNLLKRKHEDDFDS